MKSKYPMVPLGEVLVPAKSSEPVSPVERYEMAGMLNFGRGLFRKPVVSGHETSYKRLTQLRAGQFVYSRLFAWEGSVAVVPTDFAGSWVSPEFPVFDINRTGYHGYLAHIARWPGLHDELAGSGTGLGLRRQRVAPERLLAVKVPLPDIDEQRRVAAHLDSVRLGAEGLRASSVASSSGTAVLGDQAIQRVIDRGAASGWDVVPLSAVSAVNPGRTKVGNDDLVSFVPMSAVDDRAGRITRPEFRSAGEIGSGYKQFTRGDVIFARITPCMQNGKCAVAGEELPLVGYGSTEFHVVRPGPQIEAGWVHAVLRSRRVRDLAAEHFTGTAGQQRVPASFLEALPIPLPPGHDAQRAALEEIERAADRSLRLRSLSEHREALVEALLPSALNRAFAGLA